MNQTDPTVAVFYDRLAPHYHLLYDDWERSIVRQGEALARLLDEEGVALGEPILDAALRRRHADHRPRRARTPGHGVRHLSRCGRAFAQRAVGSWPSSYRTRR